jgi:hypothetical protein
VHTKDSRNLFSCELINKVGTAVVTRLLVSLAGSMSFLGSSTTSKSAANKGRINFFPTTLLVRTMRKSTEPLENPPTNSQGHRPNDEWEHVHKERNNPARARDRAENANRYIIYVLDLMCCDFQTSRLQTIGA